MILAQTSVAWGNLPLANPDKADAVKGRLSPVVIGDREHTGIHVSDGDASVGGLLGAASPRPFDGTWRMFWTQQHGDNVTWEVTRSR